MDELPDLLLPGIKKRNYFLPRDVFKRGSSVLHSFLREIRDIGRYVDDAALEDWVRDDMLKRGVAVSLNEISSRIFHGRITHLILTTVLV